LVERRTSTTLGAELVASSLAEYGWQPQGAPEAPAGAGRGKCVIVPTTAGKKLVKRYKATVDPAAILHEHSILRHLAQIELPAPRVNITSDGETLIQRDTAMYAVFDVLEGYFQYHQYWLTPAQKRRCIAASGMALGTLHATLKDFTPAGQHPHGFISRSGERVRELWWFVDVINWIRQALPELAAQRDPLARQVFESHASWIEQRLWQLNQSLRQAELPRLIIHGDYGPYNLFFKPNAPIVILDFELARLDWRLTDLATALPSFARNRLGFRRRQIRAFLDGYRTRCPIDADELALLPVVWQFLTLRRVVVLWQRYWKTGARSWLDEAQRKLDLARWIIEHQQTFARWVME
ncbi:MAG: phosphotransferase, partial [Chloroflexi bacterium]|nr:phosphotransferase [Chloroflexota bacterium]